MTVHPLSLGGVTRPPEHFKDSATGHPSVTVLSQRGGKPADPCGTRDGVESQGPNACAVVAVDGVAHRVVAVETIVRVTALNRGRRCASVPTVLGVGLLPT